MTLVNESSNNHLPTISVVVPNFNGGHTLDRALESLFSQDYPGLEVIVCDGGSTDGSADIIARHADRLAWHCSEPDRGQSHAINTGFAHATGDVVNWLCSDDQLLPGALQRIGRYFRDYPDCDVLAGNARQVDPTGMQPPHIIRSLPLLDAFPAANCVIQPSTFYRRKLLSRTPAVDESLHYVMDFELWNLFHSRRARFHFIDALFSTYEFSSHTKSGSGGSRIIDELERVYVAYAGELVPLTWWHRRLRYPVERWVRRQNSAAVTACVYWPWRLLTSIVLMPFYGFHRAARMDWRMHAY